MRVAFLTLTAENGASSRCRVYQYVPWLERVGISCTVLPAVSAGMARLLYGQGSTSTNAAYQLLELARRSIQTLAAGRFDVVVVQKALLSVGLRGFDRLLGRRGSRLVMDVDDAVHLHPSHRMPGWLGRFEDVQQSARLIRRADRVIAGSKSLADMIRRINPAVTVVPTSVDTERLAVVSRRQNEIPVIGWIGSPSTSAYIEVIAPVLARLAKRHRFTVRMVGADYRLPPGIAVSSKSWTLEGEAADLRSFDIGIMPLPDTEWARGKCGYKALQYMAVGVPAVCSPVGAAREIVRHGREGLLAATPQEWEESLEALLIDASLRSSLGAKGRARVEERYSVRANFPQLAAVLRDVAGNQRDVGLARAGSEWSGVS